MRLFLLAVAALCGFGVATAQTFHGTAEVVYGRYREADGTMRHVGGFTIPITFERIEARPAGTPRKNLGGHGLEQPQDTTVYMNDRGTNYFYTPQMASALDDLMIIPAGNNQKWRLLTLGVNTLQTSGRVMLRLRTWRDYVGGLGGSVSAFYTELWDYGIGIETSQFPGPGAYKFTLPLYTNSLIDMRVPNQQCFFAQQWRVYNIFGEGAFLSGVMSPIFSGDGPPTVGSSEDLFWYDWDPTDGVYTETEQDWYNGPPNESNFLLAATIGQTGTQETWRPTAYSWLRGVHVAGNVGSLHFSDDNRLQGNRGVVANLAEAPVQLVVDGFASTSNLISMSFRVESQVTSTSLQQEIQLFNFNTGQYVSFDTRAATQTDQTVTVNVPSNPQHYVASDGTVRAKILYRKTGPTSIANWGCRVDMAVWDIVRP
jgi:hypothetical protein